MLLIIRLVFSCENIKEAIVLDTVADLMPVTLICNHEVKATKLFVTPCRTSPYFFHFATWFFLL